ncbi:unnamed protein product [Toxocara canis]|uniref:Pept_C1 domain-containing protein n=1 Tax=Toxocara canis TaxID=6265 RepID=A0A183TZH1_TOXCA|nr:unnamed protein product [Toxocara canis]
MERNDRLSVDHSDCLSFRLHRSRPEPCLSKKKRRQKNDGWPFSHDWSHLEVTKDLWALGFANDFQALLRAQEYRISWNFIVTTAAWQDGVYGRIIGMTKTCLKRATGRPEAKAVPNERPLTYVENDNLRILRPVDYLQPKAHLAVQVDTSDKADPSLEPLPPTTRSQLIDQRGRLQACGDKFGDCGNANTFTCYGNARSNFTAAHTPKNDTYPELEKWYFCMIAHPQALGTSQES